jgi:cell division protein FtsB
MRWPLLVLLLLLALLQYPLWIGRGGWLKAWNLSQQLEEQKETNRRLEQRNAGLEAEVNDLKSGLDAVEEQARFELGFVKRDEVFVQVPKQRQASPGAADAAQATQK